MYSDVIFLSGMPRSGTSWTSQIFDSSPEVRFRLSPLFSYELKNRLDKSSSREEWEEVFAAAYRSQNEFMNQSYRREAGEYPTFEDKLPDPSTLVIKDTRFHDLTESMLEHFPKLKLVAIVRHPCGAVHSWLTTPSEFPEGADPLENWRSGACRKPGFGEFWGFDDWKFVARLFLRLQTERPGQIRIVRYEDIVADSVRVVRDLFDWCGLGWANQTKNFLIQSQTRHHEHEHAVFKSPSVAHRWKAELDTTIRDAIFADLEGSDLETFL